jgi:hypothetical protein
MNRSKINLDRFCRGVASLLALACFAGGNLSAQTTTGNIRGYVNGPGGAPVSDAQVIARMPSTNETRRTITNSSGFYYLAGLRPGAYEMTVRRVGVQPQTRSVQLGIGQTLDLNVSTSDVATTLATVQVTSARTGTETRTSEVGTSISREQISNLPNFERNVLDLAKLTPGMSAQAVNNTDKFLAAGGQPPEAVNIFVDGASYKNDVLRGGVVGQDASKGNPLPQGAIDQFRVLTQNYKAEYQKAASAIIVATTKSGSNRPEADLFAYGIGNSYVARDAITAQQGGPRPNYKRLQAGGDIGGPIIKDKLFYFGTYEMNFRDEPAYIRLGPDTLLAPPAIVSQLRGFTGQQAQQFREHLGLGKLTWNASERNTVDGSFTIRRDNDFRGFGGQTAFSAAENLRINTYTTVLNFKHAADTWLNEAQVNSQFFTWNPTAKDFTTVGKNYFGLLRIGGKDTDQDFKQNRLGFRDDISRGGLSFLGGDHALKGGVGVDFLSYTGTKWFVGNPVFNFRAAPEQYATPFQAQTGFGDPTIKRHNVQFGGYIQDDWSVTRALVLNLGLRWDAETNMINNDYVTPAPLADTLRQAYAAGTLVVDQSYGNNQTRNVNVIQELGGINRYITTGKSDRPMYKKAFQPRLGASYALPDDKTVLFGGAGLYFDRNYWNTLFDEQFRRQFQVITIDFRNNCAGATNCAAWNPSYYDPNALRALGSAVGRPEVFLVANDMVPPRTLQFSGGVRRSIGPDLLTVSYNALRGRNFMNFIRGSPWGGGGIPYNTVFVADDRVKTWFDALEVQYQRSLADNRRWGGGLAYTLSKSTEQGQSQDLFWGFDNRYPTVGDRPRLVAPGDQRHSIVANGIVRLPYEFLFSTIVNLGSGIAVNATDASQGFATGQQRTYTFQPPTRAFLGIGHVFGYQNLDVRLQKDITFASAQTAAVVLDLFNALNSHNFGCYNTTINPPNPPANNSNINYGTPGCAGLGRRLQVGIRYGFRQGGGIQ